MTDLLRLVQQLLILVALGSCTCGRETRGCAPPGRSAAAWRGGSWAARPPSPSPWRPAARAQWQCSTAASRPRSSYVCNVKVLIGGGQLFLMATVDCFLEALS